MNVPFFKKVTENHLALLMTFILLVLLVLLKYQESSTFKNITNTVDSGLVTSVKHSD